MVVQHNMQAANANRMLGITTSAQAKSTEKLSSGYKINRAADDAAGLAISEKMRAQVRGLDRASTNAQDGISVVQTAEGALNEVHSILQRMNELATQAANDTNTSIDRSQIKLEMNQLSSEIDRVASTTQFNSMNLLDGTFSSKNLQVGSLSGQKIELSIHAMNTKSLGLEDPTTNSASTVFESHKTSVMTAGTTTPADLKVSSFSDAGETMKRVQRAIDVVSTQRATLGAVQNRLEHTIANLDNISENTSAAESRIRDTDMAKEMVTYSKNNILQQAGQSMLAQANQSTQGVLSLLQG
ncbi:MAG: flagellin [Lachnospiraceae bacterium]|nr:flagellin [Lachnospiraceae bacterium]MDD7328033.1 flagellin [Lachnospiraceae bacterium]MDY2760188.1 flagellin [Lachnospiraceae bacterium]